MSIRKGVFFALTLILSAGFLFAAGGAQQQGPQTADGVPVLVTGMQTHVNVLDYYDNYKTRYVERLNGIKLEFFLLPTAAADAQARIALLVSSNDLPDVLQVNLPVETILNYGAGGAFIDQTPYIMDRARSPNFWVIPDEDRDRMLLQMTAADGKIYNQLIWNPESWDSTPHRKYINKAWLDRLGLQIPRTTDELRNVLTAFRNRDPNGNGRQDEIGVYGWYLGGYGENSISALINSFTFFVRNQLILDNSGNNVIAPFVQPGFRQALQYLNGLHRDGLLDATIFTTTQLEFRAALASDPPVVGFTTAGSAGNWVDADRNPNFLELALIPPLRGPEGVSYTPFTGYTPGNSGMISSRSRIPDIAWRYLENFYNHDLSIIARFGEEGVDWTRDPAILASQTNAYVSAGLYPSISIVETSMVWQTTHRTIWGNPGPRYASERQGNTRGSTVRPFVPDSAVAILDAYNFQWYVPSRPEHIIPLLKYTLSESQRNSMAITNVRQYVDQSIAEFTIGTRDINSDAAWNAYLRDLDSMGLQDWLTTAQAAYDRTR